MKQIIIGGVPAPIGGVTTYLRRLLHRDCDKVAYLLDIYPGEKEPVREDCAEKIVQLGSRLALLKWLWVNQKMQIGHEMLFNFSTPRALFLTLFLLKIRGAYWSLMLHHGALETLGWLSARAVRWALGRFDAILTLSDAQRAFYLANGVQVTRLTAGSSYCEPADHVDDPAAAAQFDRIKERHGKIIVMSGFPKPLYNFELGIEAVAALDREDCALCLFIYGPGELRDRLNALEAEYPWLYVFDGRSERYFNTFLRQCDLLMRLTATESFGISVWDADYWERRVLASDVCRRPDTAKVINLKTANKYHIGQLIESL